MAALDTGLNGHQPLDATLADYEVQRNAASRDLYHQNLRLAQFKPMPPEAMALRQVLRHRPEETQRFYLANQGLVARETFFNPENLQRLMAA